jgi:pyrroline-5-carboxylate reductase
VGLILWIDDEAQLDAVTALSGSGPAYFLLLMEALESAGLKLGISTEAARLLILQTAFGTAKLALESKDNVATLRTHVTSKGGTTERAIDYLEKKAFRSLIENALAEAAIRSKEIADEWGKE